MSVSSIDYVYVVIARLQADIAAMKSAPTTGDTLRISYKLDTIKSLSRLLVKE